VPINTTNRLSRVGHAVAIQNLLGAIDEKLANYIVLVTVVRMECAAYRLKIQPCLGQIEALVERAIRRSWWDSLVDVDERDDEGEVDDGGPE
jgi:hypothetical protein